MIYKFRVWDKAKQRFLRHGSECRIEATTGQVIHTFCPKGNNFIDCGHLLVDLFSGLFDKQHNPIYENDVIKFLGNWDKKGKVIPATEDLYVVNWSMGGLKAVPLELAYTSNTKGWKSVGHTDSLIVGNTHEAQIYS